MITIDELLEDSTYKKFFLRPAKLPAVAMRGTPPWRVWVLLKGQKTWRKKDFATYPEAFNFLKKRRRKGDVADAAINCRRYAFGPPERLAKIKGKYVMGSDGVKRQATTFVLWKVRLPAEEMEEHLWCPWCRRPTVFKYFTKHHAIPGLVDPSVTRCVICGASERMLHPSSRRI